MAHGESDMSLDQIIKRKQNRKPGLKTKFNVKNRNFSKTSGSSSNQSYSRVNISKKFNNNAVQQRRRGGQQQQEAQSGRRRRGGRDNVLNSRQQSFSKTDAPKSKTASTARIGGVNITKQSNNEKGLPQIRLFTKHFDARSKIQSKKPSDKSPSKFIRFKGVAQRALDDVRKENREQVLNKRRNLTTITGKGRSKLERESMFTGKSIKVVTKNNLMSITTKNRSKPTAAPSSTNHEVSKPMNKDHSSPSSFKKSVPAKVVISNLYHNVTQDDIEELFGAIGTLVDARLNGIGTAEVTYSNTEDAFAAYSKYHGRNLDGQPMILKITAANVAPPKPSSTSGFLAVRNSNKSAGRQSRPLRDDRRSSNYERNSKSSAVSSSTKPVVFTVKL